MRPNPESSNRDTAWPRALAVAGSLALGTYAAGAVARWVIRQRLPAPAMLPPAIDAPVRTFEGPEGRVNYYVRPGSGPPIVLVHSFNAAASSFEMRPLFEHLATTTDRPLFAMDWLGFGRSARADLAYRPALYLHQLRSFLQERIQQPADLIGLSLGAEYAARVAQELPTLTRRLVLISPTGLGEDRGPSAVGRFFVRASSRVGAFELLYYALTQRASIRRFYAQQVFLDPTRLPDDLVDYAYVTAHAQGAHYAPRRFVDGTLFPPSPAASVYARLYRPTLLVTPQEADEVVQDFKQVADVVAQNARDLRRAALDSGLLPQWETPGALFEVLDAFLLETDPTHAA
jgi:pimeloyl-ACP methyl ester carboxylesterase